MNNRQEETIRISDILHVILKRRMLILTLAVCGLVMGIALSVVSYMRGEMSRTYAITSAIAVTSQTQDGLYSARSRTPTSTDITLAENMTESVIYMMKSDKTLNAAIRRLSLVGISIKDIYRNLTVSKVGDTQIIEMTLYWRDAGEGVEILNAINTVAPLVLAEVLQIGNVSVVNDPQSQYRIGGSVNAKLWVLMVFLGMALGMGLCVLEMFLRPRLIEPTDMTEVFGLRLIGKVPQDREFFNGIPTLLNTGSHSVMDENFMSMARILENEVMTDKPCIIHFTSAAPREGTSEMLINLGAQLAEMERKVLLVDLNSKNPALGTLVQDRLDYYHSLNALYYGDSRRGDAIHSLNHRLDLLPTVPDPEHGLPLNEELQRILREISEDYDYVLTDLAPISVSSDVLGMKSLSEQVLFVARCDGAKLNEMKEALNRLERSGMKVVGCVANAVPGHHRKEEQKERNRREKEQGAIRFRMGPHPENKENRVRSNAGLEQEGVIDESLMRSFEEYRAEDTKKTGKASDTSGKEK